MPPVVHFEIHASDVQRAIKFYTTVFGWEIKQWGEMPYWMVMTKEIPPKEGSWGGIDGGLVLRKGTAPADGQAINAYVCTMQVDNVDKYLDLVLKAGGSLAVPKVAIPTMGWLLYCKDTEGNCFGMMHADKDAK